jgi:hypothetical protein
MAKGQMRSSKEKKKPKAEKDKKKGGSSAYAMAYGQAKSSSPPLLGASNPFAKKE